MAPMSVAYILLTVLSLGRIQSVRDTVPCAAEIEPQDAVIVKWSWTPDLYTPLFGPSSAHLHIKVSVKNIGLKTIDKISWAIFSLSYLDETSGKVIKEWNEAPTGDFEWDLRSQMREGTVIRKQAKVIKPGKTEKLTITVDLYSLRDLPPENATLRLRIQRIEYGDGSVWQRPYTGKTEVYRYGKDFGIAEYDKAIAQNPNDATAYVGRGRLYYLKESYDCAIADYNQAIAINPRLAEAYGARGYAYEAKKIFDQAIQDYSTAVQLDPTYVIGYYDKGIACERANRFAEARAAYEQFIKLAPNKYAVKVKDAKIRLSHL